MFLIASGWFKTSWVLIQISLRVACHCGLFLGETPQLLPDSLYKGGRGVCGGGSILWWVLWSRWSQEKRWSWRVSQRGAGHLENRGRGELWKRQHLWGEEKEDKEGKIRKSIQISDKKRNRKDIHICGYLSVFNNDKSCCTCNQTMLKTLHEVKIKNLCKLCNFILDKKTQQLWVWFAPWQWARISGQGLVMTCKRTTQFGLVW